MRRSDFRHCFEEISDIKQGTFSGCTNLSTVILPQGIKKIGDSAFEGCDSLKKIIYKGSEKKWETINIGDKNDFSAVTFEYGVEDIPEENVKKSSNDFAKVVPINERTKAVLLSYVKMTSKNWKQFVPKDELKKQMKKKKSAKKQNRTYLSSTDLTLRSPRMMKLKSTVCSSVSGKDSARLFFISEKSKPGTGCFTPLNSVIFQ